MAVLPTDIVGQIFFDDRIEQYEGWLPDEWAVAVTDRFPLTSPLGQPLLDLVFAWRTTSYTASMPAVSVKSIQSAAVGYAHTVTPDTSIVALIDGLTGRLTRVAPELVTDRELRGRLVSEIAVIADEVRAANVSKQAELPIAPVWAMHLKEPAFLLGLWASQRVSFVSFYNAYEAFLVRGVKHLLGAEKLRAQDKEFRTALASGIGTDLTGPCWGHHEINRARVVRHALSHAGGRETDDMRKLGRHGFVILDGVLQIVPEDNHTMLKRLRAGVDAFVAAAETHPRFALSGGPAA